MLYNPGTLPYGDNDVAKKTTKPAKVTNAKKPLKAAPAAKAPKAVAKSDVAKTFAIAAARLAHDMNCEDIVVMDLRGYSPVTDYFVIGTGTSGRQMRSVADDIVRHGKQTRYGVWHKAGMESADWIVLDFVNVVVHLFDSAHRKYYDLEMIWGDAPKVRWQRRTTAKKAGKDAAE